jgi:hypothetical protein
MRSRRINIEGNRYLIFFTFADEPWLGAAANADAGLYINDTLAEEKAAELRAHLEPVVWRFARQTTNDANDVGSATRSEGNE